MSMEQLLYNTRGGQWSRIIACRPPMVGEEYFNGVDDIKVASVNLQVCLPILQPIDPPIWATLGKNVLATVPEDERENVTGEYRMAGANERHWDGGKVYENAPDGTAVIHLRTPTPKKTAEETLQEIAELPACPARTIAQDFFRDSPM